MPLIVQLILVVIGSSFSIERAASEVMFKNHLENPLILKIKGLQAHHR
jgi:hypothetical protein